MPRLHINLFGLVSWVISRSKKTGSVHLSAATCTYQSAFFFAEVSESRIHLDHVFEGIMLTPAPKEASPPSLRQLLESSTWVITAAILVWGPASGDCGQSSHAGQWTEENLPKSSCNRGTGPLHDTDQYHHPGEELPCRAYLPVGLPTKAGGKEQESLLTIEDRDMADRVEPHNVDISCAETDSASHGCDKHDDIPDYKQIFWQPDSDSKDGDSRSMSSTTAKIVCDAFLHSLLPEKRKGIKRK